MEADTKKGTGRRERAGGTADGGGGGGGGSTAAGPPLLTDPRPAAAVAAAATSGLPSDPRAPPSPLHATLALLHAHALAQTTPPATSAFHSTTAPHASRAQPPQHPPPQPPIPFLHPQPTYSAAHAHLHAHAAPLHVHPSQSLYYSYAGSSSPYAAAPAAPSSSPSAGLSACLHHSPLSYPLYSHSFAGAGREETRWSDGNGQTAGSGHGMSYGHGAVDGGADSESSRYALLQQHHANIRAAEIAQARAHALQQQATFAYQQAHQAAMQVAHSQQMQRLPPLPPPLDQPPLAIPLPMHAHYASGQQLPMALPLITTMHTHSPQLPSPSHSHTQPQPPHPSWLGSSYPPHPLPLYPPSPRLKFEHNDHATGQAAQMASELTPASASDSRSSCSDFALSLPPAAARHIAAAAAALTKSNAPAAASAHDAHNSLQLTSKSAGECADGSHCSAKGRKTRDLVKGRSRHQSASLSDAPSPLASIPKRSHQRKSSRKRRHRGNSENSSSSGSSARSDFHAHSRSQLVSPTEGVSRADRLTARRNKRMSAEADGTVREGSRDGGAGGGAVSDGGTTASASALRPLPHADAAFSSNIECGVRPKLFSHTTPPLQLQAQLDAAQSLVATESDPSTRADAAAVDASSTPTVSSSASPPSDCVDASGSVEPIADGTGTDPSGTAGSFSSDCSDRVYEAYSPYFGCRVELFMATSDPRPGRILFRAAMLARKAGCSLNRVAMYLARQRSAEAGVFQAASFSEKARGCPGLKRGGYFVSLHACQAYLERSEQLEEQRKGAATANGNQDDQQTDRSLGALAAAAAGSPIDSSTAAAAATSCSASSSSHKRRASSKSDPTAAAGVPPSLCPFHVYSGLSATGQGVWTLSLPADSTHTHAAHRATHQSTHSTSSQPPESQ